MNKYMLLGRLQSDCENCENKRIWGSTKESHIAKMKELYNSFVEKDKPQWISWEQILDYEKKLQEVYCD